MHKTLLTALALSLALPLTACRRSQAPATPTPPDWLEGAVDEQAKQAAPGAVRVGDLYKATAFREGDRQQWEVMLDGGGCIHLSAAGDQTVEEIALYLWDPAGKRLDKVGTKSPRALLSYCPPTGSKGAYKFEAKVEEGHGHFAVGLYADAGAEGGEGEDEAGPDGDAAGKTSKPTSNLDGEVDELAKTAAPGAGKMGETFSGNASSTDWYVALEPGKCYWFVGAGEDSVDKLALYLWDPNDQRVKANSAETNRVTVGHCPDSAGMYHFRAQVTGGQGAYKVGVYAKKK